MRVKTRFIVVDDPITRALGGKSTRFGIVDTTKLPLIGKWCNAGVYSTRPSAEIAAEKLENEVIESKFKHA